MINFSILISSSEVNGPGGLFDFNATLPLVAIQFLLLMVLLNILLYNPLIAIAEKREEEISSIDADTKKISRQAEKLKNIYKDITDMAKKELKILLESQIYFDKTGELPAESKIKIDSLEERWRDIELFDDITTISQAKLDNLKKTIEDNLEDQRQRTINNIDETVNSLCIDLDTRLSI